MVNEKAIFEIGNIIHIRRTCWGKKLSAQEIVESIEYRKEFKIKYPELCKLAEGNVPIQEDIVGVNNPAELGEI